MEYYENILTYKSLKVNYYYFISIIAIQQVKI